MPFLNESAKLRKGAEAYAHVKFEALFTSTLGSSIYRRSEVMHIILNIPLQ